MNSLVHNQPTVYFNVFLSLSFFFFGLRFARFQFLKKKKIALARFFHWFALLCGVELKTTQTEKNHRVVILEGIQTLMQKNTLRVKKIGLSPL